MAGSPPLSDQNALPYANQSCTARFVSIFYVSFQKLARIPGVSSVSEFCWRVRRMIRHMRAATMTARREPSGEGERGEQDRFLAPKKAMPYIVGRRKGAEMARAAKS